MATGRQVLEWVGRSAKRIAVTVVGVALVAGGLALLVLPGPGIVVVIAGLAVLATQYAWAERALDTARSRATSAGGAVRRMISGQRARS